MLRGAVRHQAARRRRTCSREVSVSMSFCTARVPWVLSATLTSSPLSATWRSTCDVMGGGGSQSTKVKPNVVTWYRTCHVGGVAMDLSADTPHHAPRRRRSALAPAAAHLQALLLGAAVEQLLD